MKCPIETQENAGLLVDYCARRLNPETTAIVERHMESCLRCQAFRDSQNAVWQALDAWEALPVSVDFDRRLYQRIDSEAHQGWWSRLMGSVRPVLLRPALPLAAAACLIVVGGFILENPNRASKDAGATAEVDQVERTLQDLEMLRQFKIADAQ